MKLTNLIKRTEICLYLVSVAIITSCAYGNTDTTKRESEETQRIITVYDIPGYQIIEIDGQEYISTSAGGICPLVNGN